MDNSVQFSRKRRIMSAGYLGIFSVLSVAVYSSLWGGSCLGIGFGNSSAAC